MKFFKYFICVLGFVVVSCSINRQRSNIAPIEMNYSGEIIKVTYDINYPEFSYSPFSPASNNVVNFYVPNDNSIVNLSLYTINDKLVSVAFNGILNSGLYELIPTEISLQPGIYKWKLKINESSYEQKVIGGSYKKELYKFTLANGKSVEGYLLASNESELILKSNNEKIAVNKNEIKSRHVNTIIVVLN